ncbi:hypothetical protein [Streptomyces flaveolus]|uniref:hypothetical protein n=1 Tax=Streptomyces flaveolus TaxID=67297 RepID=UPI0033269082
MRFSIRPRYNTFPNTARSTVPGRERTEVTRCRRAAAFHHVAGLGHERIALLAQDTPTSPQVREGYEAAVAARGLSVLPPVTVDPDDPAALEAAARALYHVGQCRHYVMLRLMTVIVPSGTDIR